MSQQSNDFHPPPSVVTNSDSSHASTPSRQPEAYGGAGRQKDTQMNEGRASGELEGSTLGSSSRDGERGGTRGQRRMGSSSFLLDSSFLHKSKSLRASQHQRPRRSEPDRKEKRKPPEAENNVSRKKSRLPWSRYRQSLEESLSETVDTGLRAVREDPQPSNAAREEEPHNEPDSTQGEANQGEANRGSIGLDQDSIDIVNLALNLNESRRRGNIGRSASHRVSGGAWTARQPPVHYTDSDVPAVVRAGLENRSRTQGRRSFTHSFADARPRPLDSYAQQSPVNEQLSVSNLLPDTVNDGSLPHEISESTLARVDKARRHFELFNEYLRLLPSLPPLRSHAAADSGHESTRVHNPLQTIRNRKVRYREKCPINVEREGWDDVATVHEWVNIVEQQYGHQSHQPNECLELPRLGQRTSRAPQGEHDDAELSAIISPSDSAGPGRRSSSAKARRPRFDWVVSSAELLADAAWVEDGLNKSKMTDKDGNSLYPDPMELLSSDTNFDSSSVQRASLSGKRVSLDVPSRTSFSDRGVSHDIQGVGRGRSRNRFQSPSSPIHSSSASAKAGKLERRSRSSSISMGAGFSERSGFSSALSTNVRSTQDPDSPLHRPEKGSTWASADEKRPSISSAASTDDRCRMSLDAMQGTASNSPMRPGPFPSIAVNLSPQTSRSPSPPSKKRLSRKIAARRERSKSKNRAREQYEDLPLDSQFLRKHPSPAYLDVTTPSGTDRSEQLETSALPDQVSSPHQDDRPMDDTQGQKGTGQHESKLRGIFKGKGKVTAKVGNEVSKMGNFILKKDHPAHSRQSSFATSAASDDADLETVNAGKSVNPKGFLRRFPTLSDDNGRFARKDPEKDAKAHVPPIPPFTSLPENGHDEQRETSDLEYARDTREVHKVDDIQAAQPGKFGTHVSVDPNENSGIGPPLRNVQEQSKKKQIKDPSVPFSMTRPPVTGLAQAEASAPPSAQSKRPTLSGTWTISDRSIPTLADLGVSEKREIERTRALLLSSGIKAREITRRAETVRDPPPEFLTNTMDNACAFPRVTRLREFDLAAQNLQRRFEKTQLQFQQSMDRFPNETVSPLKSRLSNLENLVSHSLTPRVQAVASDAEGLSIQLNTTSTLALKQLSDTLDKGVRKRRRRLRWVRRAGFVMLEWALVGMLWWVWLIVMAFKVLRSAFRGAISGVRWVLWL
ncbi:uncharacterized protein ACHE_70778S [Aspergillus chevalieri]|uniref:Uncharacterized protein n=1 Tax=Aspergillus chevalieri TaxID=182096 RepID=A0A7R7VW93_ASPCH|nr:uncharacterized protein ACHE_70778S [Aspergillus chevalieri]BCR91935.1 hypothetical protein ACHE_70778S [Aspergillus chevalieri]